jgi:iron complex transport system ATP-binding protein
LEFEMLNVENITIKYHTCEVVKNITFNLQDGEIVALLGANGAGKTTLLRSLNATLPTSNGRILLDNKDLREFSRREIAQNIAVVAQENETKFPIKVLEFILGGRFAHGKAFGFETEQDLQFAAKALELCDLQGFENRLMNELSGGERQRIILARALATQAKILLLDEPTANVDLSHQALILKLVRERCKSGENCGSSAVVVTHDLNLASEFADKILLLKRGEIAAHGTPKEVFTTEILRKVFDCSVLVDAHPLSGKPRITMSYGR